MTTLHHRLAAVWFADVVDFTRQAAEDEERAMRVVRSFQEAAREVARRFDGRIVKFIGDAAMAEFASTEAAVCAALGLQSACAERASTAGVECPELRIGIHVGDVTTATDGDVYGDGVNLAARLVKVATPGEVWVSQDVWRQLRQRPRFQFEERGSPDLKGMGSVEVFAVTGEAGEGAPEAGGFQANVRDFLRELQRRNVYRVAVVYAIVGWLVIQVVAAGIATLGLPQGLARGVVLVVILGFPVAVSLAWAYELGPHGLRRASGPGGVRPRRRHSLVRQAAVGLALAGAVGAWLVFGPERQAVGTSTPTDLDPARIAILYFDPIGEGEEVQYLASGITDGLIHDLAQMPSLDVISREGARRYRGSDAPLDSIARDLEAGTILEGSVTQAGERVRVSAQMVNAADGRPLASVEVERPRGELFALQDELVDEISQQLRRRLGPAISSQRSRRGTSSVAAWELVQRAEALREQSRGTSDVEIRAVLRRDADSLLARAESLDPQWTEPILLRGRLAQGEGTVGALQRGLLHAGRVLRLEPRSAQGLGLRGTLEYELARTQKDSVAAAELLRRAEQGLRRAVAADPSLASAWIALADLLYNAKWELRPAYEAAQKAYEEDVFLLETGHFEWLSEIALQLKRYDDAMRWIHEGRRRYPAWVNLMSIEMAVLASKDGPPPTPAEGWRLVREVEDVAPAEIRSDWSGIMRLQVAAVLTRAGLRDSAQTVAAEGRRLLAGPYRDYADYYDAYLQLLLGRRSQALDLLAGFLTAAPYERVRVAHDHWFEDLANDARFEAMIDRRHNPFFCQILCGVSPD